MGISAAELKELEGTNERDGRFDAVLQGANFKELLLKVKVAEETYNDETRIKVGFGI